MEMTSKPRKITRNQWEALYFAFILCLWVNKFEVSQGSLSDKLPDFMTDGALSDKRIAEVQKLEQTTIESPDITFENEENRTRPCVPKCCNLNYGFTFEKKSLCVKTEDEFLPDFEDRPDYSDTAAGLPVKTRYEYFIGDPCLDGKYILDSATYPDDRYSVYANGTLLYLDQLYSKEEFCLETLNGSVRAFICFGSGKPNYELNLTFILYAIALIISIPFLLATAFVYLCFDTFRDLHGKCLSCHVLCLAIGYLVLATVQLASDQLDENLCIAAGFIIQFFFVASFFWLNVICYDTWRCIKSDFQCIYRPVNRESEKITFYLYSLYGWYAPIMLSIVTLIMDLEPAIPESYLKPNFGLQSCWFHSDDAASYYFYLPVAIAICLNVIFFVMSARKIYLEQKRLAECKTRCRNSSGETQNAPLPIRLYSKTLKECVYLFCIMGINWIAEVISWAVGGSEIIWLTTDIFNALQGIFVFYLFVVKPIRVRNEVKDRMSFKWKKIIKCDWQHQEENKRISRHWHANIHYEQDEACFDNDEENDKFLPVPPNTTAV